MLQNIIITPIDARLYRFTAAPGYRLFVRKSHRTFPTADIYPDDLPNWSAVAVDAVRM